MKNCKFCKKELSDEAVKCSSCHNSVNSDESIDKLNKGDPRIQKLLDKWINLYKSKKFKPAIEIFNSIMILDPKNIDSLNNLWICYHLSGDNDKAISSLDEALLLDPGNINTIKNRRALMQKIAVSKNYNFLNKLKNYSIADKFSSFNDKVVTVILKTKKLVVENVLEVFEKKNRRKLAMLFLLFLLVSVYVFNKEIMLFIKNHFWPDNVTVVESTNSWSLRPWVSKKELYKAVVKIMFKDNNSKNKYIWSGLIFSENWLIVTNNHLVENVNLLSANWEMKICITLWFENPPDCKYNWELVVRNPKTDLAIIKIKGNYIECDYLDLFEDKEVKNVSQLETKIKILWYPSVKWDRIVVKKWKITWYDKDINFKTDTPINRGNSWWGAFDEKNIFLGIPSYTITEKIWKIWYVITKKKISDRFQSLLLSNYPENENFKDMNFLYKKQYWIDGNFWKEWWLDWKTVVELFDWIEKNMKDYEWVILKANQIIKLKPLSPQAYKYLWDSYRSLNNYDSALVYYRNLYLIDPYNLISVLSYWNCLSLLWRYEEAIDIYDWLAKVSMNKDELAILYNNIALTYLRLCNTEASKKYYLLALDYNPENELIKINLEKLKNWCSKVTWNESQESILNRLSYKDKYVFAEVQLLSPIWIKSRYYYSYYIWDENITGKLDRNLSGHKEEILVSKDFQNIWIKNSTLNYHNHIGITLWFNDADINKKLFAQIRNIKWCTWTKCYFSMLFFNKSDKTICSALNYYTDKKATYTEIDMSKVLGSEQIWKFCSPGTQLSDIQYVRFAIWIDNTDWIESSYYITDFIFDESKIVDDYIKLLYNNESWIIYLKNDEGVDELFEKNKKAE